MKHFNFLHTNTYTYFWIGIISILLSSCTFYQNYPYTDGIYESPRYISNTVFSDEMNRMNQTGSTPIQHQENNTARNYNDTNNQNINVYITPFDSYWGHNSWNNPFWNNRNRWNYWNSSNFYGYNYWNYGHNYTRYRNRSYYTPSQKTYNKRKQQKRTNSNTYRSSNSNNRQPTQNYTRSSTTYKSTRTPSSTNNSKTSKNNSSSYRSNTNSYRR